MTGTGSATCSSPFVEPGGAGDTGLQAECQTDNVCVELNVP